MKVEKISYKSARWNEWVKKMDSWSFFYLSDWYRCFLSSIKEPRIEVYDEKIIFPYIERRFPPFFRRVDSGPLGSYGGPLLIDQDVDEELIAEIVERIAKKSREVHLFLHPFSQFKSDAFDKFFKREQFRTNIIELSVPMDDIYGKFTDSKKRNIRKAEEMGLLVKEIKTENAISKYYLMYIDSLRRWNDKKRFSEKFFVSLLASNMASLYVVTYHGEYISGAIILQGNKEAFYWHGASFQRYFHLRPNDFLHFEIIRNLKDKGLLFYNMGWSEIYPGVEKFKRGFGARQVEYSYYHIR